MEGYKGVIDILIFTALFDIPDEIRGSDSQAPGTDGKEFQIFTVVTVEATVTHIEDFPEEATGFFYGQAVFLRYSAD
jgi:hypothetical protein